MTRAGDGRERLTAADASNIVMDRPDQVNVFLIAGVLAPGGPVGPDGVVDLGALRSALARRLPAVPRLSQRVVHAGRALVWEPTRVDLERHVRQVDPVEGYPGLEALCSRLMVTPLPLDRPLWELLVVPGVGSGRAGIVLRIQHAMADGIAAVRLVEALVERGAEPVPHATGSPGSDDALSRATGRSGSGLAGPADRVGPARRGLGTRLRTIASGFQRTAAVLRRAVPRTTLLGPLGPHRGIAFVDAGLESLATAAHTVGATVNDALLAAAAGATEAALRARGDPVPSTLPASVPVALGERGRSGNAVGVMLVPLPTGETDVAHRLRRIAELTRAAKADARSRGTYELTRTRLGARLFIRLAQHQRLVVMFVTNVPGPRHPLVFAGAPLESVWPVAAMQGNVRLAISAISYDGMLRCAVHCDADALPAEVLAEALRAEFGRIAALA